jgi:hypothetical protein
MGYFSNGSEGEAYEAKWCAKCLHNDGCAVWFAHLIHNYDECNKDDSILHLLIPRTADKIHNERCSMFVERELLSPLALRQFATKKAKRNG